MNIGRAILGYSEQEYIEWEINQLQIEMEDAELAGYDISGYKERLKNLQEMLKKLDI